MIIVVVKTNLKGRIKPKLIRHRLQPSYCHLSAWTTLPTGRSEALYQPVPRAVRRFPDRWWARPRTMLEKTRHTPWASTDQLLTLPPAPSAHVVLPVPIKIKCISWNINGLPGKTRELRYLLETTKPDITVITETRTTSPILFSCYKPLFEAHNLPAHCDNKSGPPRGGILGLSFTHFHSYIAAVERLLPSTSSSDFYQLIRVQLPNRVRSLVDGSWFALFNVLRKGGPLTSSCISTWGQLYMQPDCREKTPSF